MIRFVLDDPGLPALECLLRALTLRGFIVEQHPLVAHHHSLQAAEREAPFKEGRRFLAQGRITRVEDGQEVQRCAVPHGSRLRVDVKLVLKDRQLERNPDLGSGESYAWRLMHDIAHEDYQLLELGVADLALDGGGMLAEHGMPGLHDGRQGTCGQDLLDPLPELRRRERSGRRYGNHGESLTGSRPAATAWSASVDAMADQISSEPAALERVLDFIRTLEAGGGGEAIRPFLAADFRLFEAPHLLAPEGSTRTLEQVLAGANQSGEVVADQKFEIRRTTCEGGRVVLEADWSATVLMDLKYWDAGETIRARTSSVFEVREGLIVSQDSYDCYFLNS
jgi:hypothetical protein